MLMPKDVDDVFCCTGQHSVFITVKPKPKGFHAYYITVLYYIPIVFAIVMEFGVQ